jgi:hypothetical protein
MDLRWDESGLNEPGFKEPRLMKRAAWLDRCVGVAPGEVAQCRLEFVAAMEGNHAAGQVEIFHAFEPHLLHQLL